MRFSGFALALAGSISLLLASSTYPAGDAPAREDRLVTSNAPGRTGGHLTLALRTEPKTLNPASAVDETSRELIECLNADLIHINRNSQKTEPALAKSWTVSRDGKEYTLHLRQGLRFSDGQPFTADDVTFSFEVYLDETVDAPQRDLLIVGGKPISVEKVDAFTVRFRLAQPYAAAERLFDGVSILPRHLLEPLYRKGELANAWGISAAPAEIAGLGPYRLKAYAPGESITLERNPYYWKEDKNGTRLPYADELHFLFVPSEDAQIIRFESGDTDVLTRFDAQNVAVLQNQQQARGFRVYDLGPGLEYNFLFFNLNDVSPKDLPEVSQKQSWFRDVRFREAVSYAIDRQGIVRLVYSGRATPLWGNVTPGNKLWIDQGLPHPAQSASRARELLRSAGFSWTSDGSLVDSAGHSVEFSILTSSSNSQRTQIATIIQDDLKQLGMNVHVVALQFGEVVKRLTKTHDYEAAIMGLVSGDADPTPEMNVWLSSGDTHLWHPNEAHPATPWEAEIDQLMEQQLVTLDYAQRKRLYDRVQEIIAQNVPVICLASPNILVAAKNRVRNFQPSVLAPYALWNVEELSVQ